MKHWLSLDWGTSSFRLKLISTNDQSILLENTDLVGIAEMHRNIEQTWPPLSGEERQKFFLATLKKAISQLEKSAGFSLKNTAIIASGMITSTLGMSNLPYVDFPVDLKKPQIERYFLAPTASFEFPLLLISGGKTPTDVMRGEETLLIGAYHLLAKDGLLIFPGTHSKHVWIENGVARDFKTYMTGEIFEILSKHSILSASIHPSKFEKYRTAFLKGVEDAQKTEFTQVIFGVRTKQLFEQLTKEENFQYLSGLCIGAELQNMQSNTLMLICGGKLEAQYKAAIELLYPDAAHIKVNETKALLAGQQYLGSILGLFQTAD